MNRTQVEGHVWIDAILRSVSFLSIVAGSATHCAPVEKGQCSLRAIKQCCNNVKLVRTGFRVLAGIEDPCLGGEMTYSDRHGTVSAIKFLSPGRLPGAMS